MYKNFVLLYPKRIIFSIVIIVAILGNYSLQMQIDASADTLLLDNDKDLALARIVSKRYATQDFLIVTFSPNDKNLLSDASLKTIQNLSNDLIKLPLVESVTSILNVPLLQSPPQPIKKIKINNIYILLISSSSLISWLNNQKWRSVIIIVIDILL